ncbi:HEPN domain-containing protein [Dapis sp. BLCC M126]|uniref:HEPN domain-containing protein n=1 Tax=Dapis sp. BLCC M126 TaxID=3400189 RepID=UPI003CF3EFCB
MIAIHNSVKAQSTSVLDLSDILRASLVLVVSALDFYIHEVEVVRLGMLEIHQGLRPEPPAFSRFQISLATAREGLKYLEDEIRQRHSYKSFQQPDSIADAIRLISDKKLWLEVANIMGRTDKDIKQELKIIIDRRNKIAHEADIDPTLSLGNRWAIDEIMVGGAVNFIEQVVDSIHSII